MKIKTGKMLFTALVMSLVFTMNVQAEDAGEKERQRQRELIAEKKAELNDHEWDVQLKSPGSKGNPETDVLIFKEQKFESRQMAENGYQPTNYTISLQENGPTVWETMQTSTGKPTVFWRGEWKDDKMTGVLSRQIGEGQTEDLYFSSTGSKKIEPPVVVPPPVEVPAEVSDAVAPEDQATAEAEQGEAEEVTPEPAEEDEIVEAAVPAENPDVEEPKKKKKGWF